MEPDRAEAAQGFARDLRELHLRAGKPSYAMLERLSDHLLRRTTMSDILNGNRTNLPDWRFVRLFVEACHAAARENGLGENGLGSLADWKRHWDGASIGVIDARFPGRGNQFPLRTDQDQFTNGDRVATYAGSGPTTEGRATTDAPLVTWGAMPPRLTDFVGRESWLADLRLALDSESRAGPVVIQGLCGTGKTQLAAEYAHRYASAYDLIWWIPCEDEEAALEAMADLRSRLGLPPAAQEDAGYTDVFDLLRRGEPYARWLLIFDGADEPDEVRHLAPPLGGHVLVTSRNSRWEATGSVLELDVLTREESIEFLRRRVPWYSSADAYQIAEAVGDLPLLLEHAAESRATIAEYLTRLRSDPLGLLDSQPSDYPATVAAQWEENLSRLRAQAPDALDLLSRLCFFGSASIPREALERGRYQDASILALLHDPIRFNVAIVNLRRAGLLRVDTEARTLTVHQVTRWIVRYMVARDGAASEKQARHDVHLLLAAADPLNPEDPGTWRGYEQLLEHVAEADLEGCTDEAARRLLVNMTHYLNVAGEPKAALSLADRVLGRWEPEGRLRIQRARVDALIACGRYQEALRSQQDTLALMQSDADGWADEITLLGRVPGACHRVRGEFTEALTADLESRAGYEKRFGRDHPYSFAAAGDVILDLALTGRVAEAIREASQLCGDCRAFYNDSDHPAVLRQRNMLARCLWLHGQYDEAASTMTSVHAGYQALAGAEVLGQDHPWRLAHEVDYAVVLRDSAKSRADLGGLAAVMQDVRRRCWRTVGANHPQTLAATVVLASILRMLPGRRAEAIRALADAQRRYLAALPGHPFTDACTSYLAQLRDQDPHGDPAAVADFTPLPL